MRSVRRLVILTPMITAIIVAGGVTAALAFFVLPGDNRPSIPGPQGTTISAPTVAETVGPAGEATEVGPPTATVVPEESEEQGEEVAQLPEETTLEYVEESTPKPRVIRRPTGPAPADAVATETQTPTREPTAEATRDDQLLPNPPPAAATATATVTVTREATRRPAATEEPSPTRRPS